jgi:hypothetical protein
MDVANCQIELPPNRIAKSNRQIELPIRLIEFESPIRIAKSIRLMDLANQSGRSCNTSIRRSINLPNGNGKWIWQIDPAFLQHINRLQIKFAIQIGLLTASI